jgi:hypothetical protein
VAVPAGVVGDAMTADIRDQLGHYELRDTHDARLCQAQLWNYHCGSQGGSCGHICQCARCKQRRQGVLYGAFGTAG